MSQLLNMLSRLVITFLPRSKHLLKPFITPLIFIFIACYYLDKKDPDAGRDWGQEEKGMTEDEMAGWHHQLDRHEFE